MSTSSSTANSSIGLTGQQKGTKSGSSGSSTRTSGSSSGAFGSNAQQSGVAQASGTGGKALVAVAGAGAWSTSTVRFELLHRTTPRKTVTSRRKCVTVKITSFF